MEKTIGQIIREKRTERGWTQEQLAERLNVTAQAVSKWERDESYPDVTLWKELAKALSCSVGELVGEEPETRLVAADKVDSDRLLLRIRVNSSDGDKVNVNLPVSILSMLSENEQLLSLMTDGKGNALKGIDFDKILRMASMGVVGKLVEVQSSDGDTVEIWVE